MDARIVKLTQSSAIYGIGNMLQRFAGLLLLPVFTRYLTPGEYGAYALLTILGALVQPIFNLGMNAAMGPSYFKAREARGKDRVIWSALLLCLVSASALLLIAWLQPQLALRAALVGDEYAYAASVFLSGIAANILITPLAQKLQFEQRAQAFVAIRVVGTLAFALVSVFTVVGLDRGVAGVVEAQTAGYLLSLALFFLFGRPHGPVRVERRILQSILRTGLPMVPSFAFLFIMANAGRYALQLYAGESAVGTYSVGFQIGTAINMLISALATAWYPFFMSYIDKREEAAILFGKLTTYYVLTVGCVCLAIFAGADLLSHYLVDPAFYDSRQVVGLISLAFACTGLFNLFLPPVYFHDRVYLVMPIQACAAGVSILFAALLVPRIGLIGAALSMLAGHLSMATMLHLHNRLAKPLSFKIEYAGAPLLRFIGPALFILLLSAWDAPPENWSFYLKPPILISAALLSVYGALGSTERRQLTALLCLRHLRSRANRRLS